MMVSAADLVTDDISQGEIGPHVRTTRGQNDRLSRAPPVEHDATTEKVSAQRLFVFDFSRECHRVPTLVVGLIG